MANTRDEVIQSLREVDERVERLTPSITARGDSQLYADGWVVREALCHLAARSTGKRMLDLMDTIRETGEYRRAGGPPIDDVNHGQVEERTGVSVPELLQEIRDGHRQAIQVMGEVDDELLAKSIPNFTGDGEMTVADLFIRGIAGHENNHLNDIETAVTA